MLYVLKNVFVNSGANVYQDILACNQTLKDKTVKFDR